MAHNLPRDEILARARGAGDEHVGVRPRDLGEVVEEARHDGGCADERPESTRRSPRHSEPAPPDLEDRVVCRKRGVGDGDALHTSAPTGAQIVDAPTSSSSSKDAVHVRDVRIREHDVALAPRSDRDARLVKLVDAACAVPALPLDDDREGFRLASAWLVDVVGRARGSGGLAVVARAPASVAHETWASGVGSYGLATGGSGGPPGSVWYQPSFAFARVPVRSAMASNAVWTDRSFSSFRASMRFSSTMLSVVVMSSARACLICSTSRAHASSSVFSSAADCERLLGSFSRFFAIRLTSRVGSPMT